MREKVHSSQFTVRSGVSRHHGIEMVKRCPVKDCGNRTWGEYCYECAAQIETLDGWHRLPDRRESRARMAFSDACRGVRRRLWMPMLALAVGTFSYLAFLILEDAAGWHFLEGGLQ